MRTKSLVEPTGKINEGHEWLSPDGHSPSWYRIFHDGKWEEALDHEEFDPESLEEIEIEIPNGGNSGESTEGKSDEQGMQAAVSDSNGGEQGAGGKPEPEPKQRGKRGKVQSRRKGK